MPSLLLRERVLNGYCPICNRKLYSHVTADLTVVPNSIKTKRVLLDGMFVEVCSEHSLKEIGNKNFGKTIGAFCCWDDCVQPRILPSNYCKEHSAAFVETLDRGGLRSEGKRDG